MSVDLHHPDDDLTPTDITIYVCRECGYWRQEERTGVHQTVNPKDPNGKMVRHALRPLLYQRVEWDDV